MDLKRYDELRTKLKRKDFEGKNKNLDGWLFKFSFLGNIGSIFFAFFLVYPSLYKTISLQVVDGFWGNVIAITATIIFLIMFELIKRYLIRNFSNDFIVNDKNLKPSIIGWFIITTLLIALSFYLSIAGSKNFATTGNILHEKNDIMQNIAREDIKLKYNNLKKPLIKQNNMFREKVNTLPDDYITVSERYQKLIDENDNKLKILDEQQQNELNELNVEYQLKKTQHETDDYYNILLFIIIVIFNELIIIGGVYFREYYEYNLFLINQKKYDKIYLKRDRYRSLLKFIYGDGKLNVGDKVISAIDLKDLVNEKTNISGAKKFVDEFLRDMDSLGVFTIHGKRRLISVSYQEALLIVQNFDDIYQVLENMK